MSRLSYFCASNLPVARKSCLASAHKGHTFHAMVHELACLFAVRAPKLVSIANCTPSVITDSMIGTSKRGYFLRQS